MLQNLEIDLTMSEEPMSVKKLMRVVEQSLSNEMKLDVFIKNKFCLRDEARLPDFKILKLIVIKKRIGFFWNIALAASPIIVAAKILAQWAVSILYSLSTNSYHSTTFIRTTSSANNERIRRCVGNDSDASQLSFQLDSLRFLSKSQSLLEIVELIFENLKSLTNLCFGVSDNKLSLLLHYNNSFEMLLLAKFINSNPQFSYVTDDHYQRWSFVMSHLAKRLQIVQHGYLDNVREINFDYEFGDADSIFVWREEDKLNFSNFIKCDQYFYASLSLDLAMSEFGEKCLFLASSSPHLSVEIDFLTLLKRKSDTKIIVKLHPLHTYPIEVEYLLVQADKIWTDDDFPFCKVFVSFNSALEIPYAASGCAVVRLESYDCNQDALNDVIMRLQL